MGRGETWEKIPVNGANFFKIRHRNAVKKAFVNGKFTNSKTFQRCLAQSAGNLGTIPRKPASIEFLTRRGRIRWIKRVHKPVSAVGAGTGTNIS